MQPKQLICPVITPKELEATQSLINFVASDGDGPDYLYVLSQVGEFQHLSEHLRIDFAQRVVTAVAELKVPLMTRRPKVVINITGNQDQKSQAIDSAIRLARSAEALGADAIAINPVFMNTSPWHGSTRMSRKGVTDIVRQVISATKQIDLWIHNQPDITQSKNIRTQTIKKLASEPRITAIIDQSSDAKRIQNYHRALNGSGELYVGTPVPNKCEHLTQGLVAQDANILPAAWRRATVIMEEGDLKGDYLRNLLSTISSSHLKNSITALKALLRQHGVLPSDDCWSSGATTSESDSRELEELYQTNQFLNLISKGKVPLN